MTHIHTQKVKVKGQSVEKVDCKQMDGQMEAIALPPMPMRSVNIS